MKKFEGILFCTDLDGTLFTSDKTVSKENLDAIEYFKSEGGLFTFITGRMPSTSKEIYNIIKPNAPFGCVNGAGIYDGEAQKYLWSMSLPKSAMELVETVEKEFPDIGIQINAENNIYFYKDNDAMVRFRRLTNAPKITCDSTDVGEKVLKAIFSDLDEKKLFEVIEFLKDQKNAKDFDFIRSERTLYELLPKGASKGNALVKMAELLNIDIRRTIAVGDYNNDISMITKAGMGFAVENALPEVKAAADRITAGNNDSAIAKIIGEIDKKVWQLA